MDKVEILRKRNMELVQEVTKLHEIIAEQEQKLLSAQTLSKENEIMREELSKVLNDTYALRQKYQSLIKEMQDFKKTVKGRTAIERLVFDLKRK